MALPASAFSRSNIQIKLFKCQLCSPVLVRAWNQPASTTCSVKLPRMAQFSQPPNVKLHIDRVREKLQEVIPDSLKDFPWKKAEHTALKQLLPAAQKALRWSLITLFTLSSISDVIYSISRNKELLIPIGLFFGCTMTDFLKETSQELFRNSEETRLSRHLLGIGCFFVLVKIISTYFLVRGQVFLLHVANGGLMQVLWLWRSLREKQERDDRVNFSPEDASPTMNTED
ncbi:uncharacterized protein LOC132274051 [Cornus florida]|uniref:uncharacterized protein LOC132274051 n=1 Tax=Cornus florida TaxID=4283 RepID=UPI00289E0A6F|nr:uncharacterized protein LOC132274051 [Cornus florida]